jgi:hypothetical protein
MTLPYERTRALRFGWEYLTELRDSSNLTQDQRLQIERIWRHYPTAAEIKRWALMDSLRVTDQHVSTLCKLEPEKESAFARSPVSAEPPERGPTTPSERTRALRSAEQFFHEIEDAPNLTETQRLQIPYVLRHFPRQHEIVRWAATEDQLKERAVQNPGFEAWLTLENRPPIEGKN